MKNFITSLKFKIRLIQLFLVITCLSASTDTQAQWIQQGPQPSFNGQVEGITNRPVSGAIQCVAPHPSDSDILYIGSTNGGVWRTSNATSTIPSWELISVDISSQSIGALEFDPTDANNNTLVVGNGYTSSFYSRGSGSRGIFKTTNGQGPWVDIDPNNNIFSMSYTGVAPRGNTIVAAGSRGIYRTINNGNSWTRISGQVGSGLPFGSIFDLVSDPSDDSILYAVGTIGVFKSINTGESWDPIGNTAINTTLNNCINSELAVGNSNNVFVAIVSSNELGGLFRSGNGGNTWTAMDLPTSVEDGTTLGLFNGRASSRFLSLAADPVNSNIVYIGGKAQPRPLPNSIGADDFSGRLFSVNASLASGSQALHITHDRTANNSAPHADSRDMDFNANGDLLESDDGGVYMHTAPENTTGDWFSLNGNLNLSESHSLDWDEQSNIPFIGLQDNGNTMPPTSGSFTWSNVTRGDGGDIAIGDIGGGISTRYFSAHKFGGFRFRQFNTANTFIPGTEIEPQLIDQTNNTDITTIDSFGFVTPIKLNSQNALRLLIGSRSTLYESSNQGATVSPILLGEVNGSRTAGRDVLVYGTTDNPELIYAGISDSLQVRTSAGGNFALASGYSGSTITGITVNPSNSQNVFVMDNNSVFMSTNGGNTFDDITWNLSSISGNSFLSIAYISNSSDGMLAVGSSTGVYIASGPDFDTWSELSPELPQVRIEELVYSVEDEILIASTLGRGLWTYIFNERDPVDISLVLDFSGSMLQPACPICEPKINVLKRAVEIFLQLWRALAVDDDIVNTTYFRTNVTDFRMDGTNNLNVIDRTDEIINNVNIQMTTSSEKTALGGGLQLGINELSNTSRPRHVILFTDGMQNMDPGVRFPQLDIVNGEYTDASDVFPTNPPTDLDNLGAIRIHSIGVGAAPAFFTQLSEISNATNGLIKVTTAPDDDLIQFYIEELIEILRDFSPQLITYRKNLLVGQNTESVDINPSASQVLFKISYPNGKQPGIKIKNGGVDVTHLAKVTEGNFYDIYHYPLEKLSQARTIGGSNEWAVDLSRGGFPIKYQLAVIADENVLDFDLGLTNPTISSGTPANIFTELKTTGGVFMGKAKVYAFIKCPIKPLGNILSKFKIPEGAKFKFEKGMLLGEKKYAYMRKYKKYQKYFKTKTSKIELKPTKNGRFEGIFKKTKVCGNCLIEFRIEGEDEEVGYFKRIESRSLIIEFGKFDKRKSKYSVKKIDDGIWRLNMKPMDINKNLLGPDQLKYFSIVLENGEILKQTDNGDGSYEFRFSADTKNPIFGLKYKDTVWVKKQKLE